MVVSCSGLRWRERHSIKRLLLRRRNMPRIQIPLVFRFTIIWEKIIVIIREKRAEVIAIIGERVEPRVA